MLVRAFQNGGALAKPARSESGLAVTRTLRHLHLLQAFNWSHQRVPEMAGLMRAKAIL
jgi:hypothetical protein